MVDQQSWGSEKLEQRAILWQGFARDKKTVSACGFISAVEGLAGVFISHIHFISN
jgi:hypothetical protein